MISCICCAELLRHTKTVNNVKTTHVWDGSNIALELNNSNAVSARYIRGVNLIKTAANVYFLYNAHGDVVQLTNSSGAKTKDYRYDAFGVEIGKVDNDANPWRYCGEYWDEETGTVYLRARRYDPRTGRFLSEDPIRDGLNWYTYCGNNPVIFVDPSGCLTTHRYVADCGGVSGFNMAYDKDSPAKAFGQGFVDFFTAQWYALNGLINDPLGSYVSYMTDAWNWFPWAKLMMHNVTEVYMTWDQLFNGDFDGLAYRFGQTTAQGVEILVINAAGKVVGTLVAKFEGASKGVDITNDVLEVPRTGSALKLDRYHAFNDIVDNYAGQASRFNINNGTLYQLEGSLNGVQGRFEWIIQDGAVSHRMFVPGGTITGVPIKP